MAQGIAFTSAKTEILWFCCAAVRRKPNKLTSSRPRFIGATTMPKRTRSYNSWRLTKLVDPQTAQAYLKAAMSDSPKMFLKALKNVAQARFQMTHVARVAGVKRETLYKSLSSEGNPTLDTLSSVLSVLDMGLTVELKTPIQIKKHSTAGTLTRTGHRPAKGVAVLGIAEQLNIGSKLPIGNLQLSTSGLGVGFYSSALNATNRENIASITLQQGHNEEPMDDKTIPEKPIGQGIDYRTTEDFVVRYANNTFFEPTLYDLKIIFGQSDQRAGHNVVNQHTSITLSWTQLKVALYFLNSNLAAYEAIHSRIVVEPGIIPSVSEQPPKEIPGVPQAAIEKTWAIFRNAYERFVKENPEAAPVVPTKLHAK
jgi:probable addiction module antidote protein